jgi:hypothetical protein
MSINIYSREECKKIIDELEIIEYGKYSLIQRQKITLRLMESILFYTKNCRDNITERIYWILNSIEDYPSCKECGKQFQPRFYGMSRNYNGWSFCLSRCSSKNESILQKSRQTCQQKYGCNNANQSPIIKEKKKQTCLEKYGKEFSFQSEIVKEKSKQTCLKNHGVEFAQQSEIIKEKGKQTCLEKYGYENVSQSLIIQEKKKQTCLKKLGVEFPAQSEKIQEKSKQTCLEKYGVENCMQNKDVFVKCQKNMRKKKKLISPSGSKITYQGYENVAYFKLLEDGYKEEQIVTDNKLIPSFKYFFETERTYFPDIFIPHQNKIIEVKSTWTYKKSLEQNYCKKQACLDQGYLFEFWICSDKEILEIL